MNEAKSFGVNSIGIILWEWLSRTASPDFLKLEAKLSSKIRLKLIKKINLKDIVMIKPEFGSLRGQSFFLKYWTAFGNRLWVSLSDLYFPLRSFITG